jgi:glutaredoxin
MPSETSRIHVTLLTSPQCGYCEDAKATLTRLAHDYPLVVELVELRSPAGERLALQGGVLFPPGLFLDGEPFSYGRVSERKLRQELARRCTSTVTENGKVEDATERLVV